MNDTKEVIKTTREEIAKQNLKEYEGLGRIIEVQDMYFNASVYAEDTVITLKKAKSFAGQDVDEQFKPETSLDGDLIQIVFNCDDAVMAHKVDYENEEEVDALSAVKGEDEYLVPEGTHFVITASSNEDDIAETGYFEVDIDQISEEEYQQEMADGAREIYDI